MSAFQYGLQVELKRRVRTRAGDSVATKLARDVHCLVTVLDGGEFSDLTELMSLPRINKSNRSQSISHGGNIDNKCDCHVEFQQLKNDMAYMRADFMLIKQKLSVTEIRQDQIKLLTGSLKELKI